MSTNSTTHNTTQPCDDPRISAYHDGELAADQRRAVEIHLAACGACAAELARLRAISRAFTDHALAIEPMPRPALDRLHDAVGAAFEERTSGTGDVLRLTRFVTGLAAAIMVAAGSWIVMGPRLVTDPVTQVNESAAVVPPWEDPRLLVATTFDAGTGGAETPFAQWVVADLSRGASE